MMLKHLNEVNDVPIFSVNDDSFKTYGKVIEGYNLDGLISAMKETPIPESGNIYVASVSELEALDIKDTIQSVMYGGMPIQIGYCNGRNTTYNGFEYHKGSEINIAVTDMMLVLSHTWCIQDNTISADDARVFFVPKGTMIEMFQTTLHLSPCRVTDEGFKDVVILPKGTNTPLTDEEKELRNNCTDSEARLLLQKNKWVLAHPERKPLIDQGAHPGFKGENKELKY